MRQQPCREPRKLLIIFNPNAGSGRSRQYLLLIEAYCKAMAIEYQIKHSKHSGHAQSIVKHSDLSQFVGVIAAGGDGTLFEVVNGLMHHKAENRPPLGVIPVGTGNAFARELGLLPTDWKAGIDIIIKQNIKTIDLGHAKMADDGFYFINIIGMGFVVDAGKTTQKIKNIGKSSYTLATLWQTIKLKKYPIKLTLTDANNQIETIDQDLVFVEVANSRYTGTSFLMAPEAKIDDGLLDVVILKNISRIKILRLFPTIYSGKHINYPEVTTRQVKSITIETQQAMPLMPDGEFLGQTPVTISCVKQALNIFI